MKRCKYLFTLLLLVFSLCLPFFALAANTPSANEVRPMPPFPGGPVTSPFGAKEDFRTDPHGGVDFGYIGDIYAPTDGYVTHLEQAGGGGVGLNFVFAEGPFKDHGIEFWDLTTETRNMPTGFVRKGTKIGTNTGSDDGQARSTGSHIHIEYQPGGLSGGVSNPVGVIQWMGIKSDDSLIADGDAVYNGKDKPGLPWNIEALMTMGDNINEVIKDFTKYAKDAMKYLHQFTIDTLIALAIIDFAMMINLSNFNFSPLDILPKLMKYGFFIMLINYYDKFINWFCRGFVEATSTIYGGGNTAFSTDVSQPQLLLQKAIYLIQPALTKISTFGARDFVNNFASVFAIWVLCIIVMAVFIVVALYIMLCYVEFYVSAGISIFTVPFGVLHWTKFISEGSLGHVISSALKLVIVSCMVALCTVAIKDAQVQDLFSATVDVKQEAKGIPTDPTGNGYVAMIYEEAAKAGVDGDWILAIAMRESGGDTVDGIRMLVGPDAGGGYHAYGIMQVMEPRPGKDGVLRGETGITEDGREVDVSEEFPLFKSDPLQNIQAGIAVYKYKLQEYANGDPKMAAGWYFGDPRSSYPQQVEANYLTVKSGNYGALYGNDNKNPHKITAEQLAKFLTFCLILCGFAILILKLPNRIVKPLQGSVELP